MPANFLPKDLELIMGWIEIPENYDLVKYGKGIWIPPLLKSCLELHSFTDTQLVTKWRGWVQAFKKADTL